MNQPDTNNEVARLRDELERSKEMVMDAARRGDMMASHWKERSEKAEAIVQQLHHYAGIIEGFRKGGYNESYELRNEIKKLKESK
jgi:hypothetical protein